MNSTQRTIAIVAVAVLLAAGIVGVGYAYTTQTDITDNTAPSEYFLISSGDETPTVDSYKEQFTTPVDYNTIITAGSFDDPSTTETETYLHMIQYYLNTDAEAMTGSAYGMKIVELGSIKLAVATQDGAAPDFDSTTAGTYDIEVLIPAEKMDSDLYYFAKAAVTGYVAPETDPQFDAKWNDHTFDPADTTVEKFVYIADGPDAGNYAVYLTVPDANSYYTVYIGASLKGDSPKVVYTDVMPDEAAKVLDDATVTFRVNSESLMATTSGMIIDFNGGTDGGYALDVVAYTSSIEAPGVGTVILKPFVSALSYGTVTTTYKIKQVTGDTPTYEADQQLTIAEATGVITTNTPTSTAHATAGLHEVTAEVKDNQSAWKEGASNVKAVISDGSGAQFAITYTLGTVTMSTTDETNAFEYAQLVMPIDSTRTPVLPEGYTISAVTGNNKITLSGSDIVAASDITAGTYDIVITGITSDYREFTNTYSLSVRTAALEDIPTLLISSGGTTGFKDSAAVVPTDSQNKIVKMFSTDTTKVNFHKSAKYYVDAVAVGADVPVYVIVQEKDAEGNVVYSMADLQIDVVTATLTCASALTVGTPGAAPAVALSDSSLVGELTVTSSDARYVIIGASNVLTPVAAGTATVTVSFTFAGAVHSFIQNITVSEEPSP